MESKTIRVQRQGLLKPSYGKESCWYRTADSRIAVVFPFQEFDQDRELDVTISIVASPEERLREARIAALKEFWRVNPVVDSYDEERIITEVIERVDAEFAKGSP